MALIFDKSIPVATAICSNVKPLLCMFITTSAIPAAFPSAIPAAFPSAIPAAFPSAIQAAFPSAIPASFIP